MKENKFKFCVTDKDKISPTKRHRSKLEHNGVQQDSQPNTLEIIDKEILKAKINRQVFINSMDKKIIDLEKLVLKINLALNDLAHKKRKIQSLVSKCKTFYGKQEDAMLQHEANLFKLKNCLQNGETIVAEDDAIEEVNSADGKIQEEEEQEIVETKKENDIDTAISLIEGYLGELDDSNNNQINKNSQMNGFEGSSNGDQTSLNSSLSEESIIQKQEVKPVQTALQLPFPPAIHQEDKQLLETESEIVTGDIVKQISDLISEVDSILENDSFSQSQSDDVSKDPEESELSFQQPSPQLDSETWPLDILPLSLAICENTVDFSFKYGTVRKGFHGIPLPKPSLLVISDETTSIGIYNSQGHYHGNTAIQLQPNHQKPKWKCLAVHNENSCIILSDEYNKCVFLADLTGHIIKQTSPSLFQSPQGLTIFDNTVIVCDDMLDQIIFLNVLNLDPQSQIQLKSFSFPIYPAVNPFLEEMWISCGLLANKILIISLSDLEDIKELTPSSKLDFNMPGSILHIQEDDVTLLAGERQLIFIESSTKKRLKLKVPEDDFLTNFSHLCLSADSNFVYLSEGFQRLIHKIKLKHILTDV